MRIIWTFVGLVAIVTVAAGAAHYGGAPALLTFVLATVALAGLAWIFSFATEQVGERFGPAVTGVLQSTLGNLPEFFIVMFALSAGEIVVAQTSIIGSIFANALLVLGLVIIAGCSSSADGVMRFHARLPKDNATLMLLASFLIVVIVTRRLFIVICCIIVTARCGLSRVGIRVRLCHRYCVVNVVQLEYARRV